MLFSFYFTTLNQLTAMKKLICVAFFTAVCASGFGQKAIPGDSIVRASKNKKPLSIDTQVDLCASKTTNTVAFQGCYEVGRKEWEKMIYVEQHRLMANTDKKGQILFLKSQETWKKLIDDQWAFIVNYTKDASLPGGGLENYGIYYYKMYKERYLQLKHLIEF